MRTHLGQHRAETLADTRPWAHPWWIIIQAFIHQAQMKVTCLQTCQARTHTALRFLLRGSTQKKEVIRFWWLLAKSHWWCLRCPGNRDAVQNWMLTVVHEPPRAHVQRIACWFARLLCNTGTAQFQQDSQITHLQTFWRGQNNTKQWISINLLIRDAPISLSYRTSRVLAHRYQYRVHTIELHMDTVSVPDTAISIGASLLFLFF